MNYKKILLLSLLAIVILVLAFGLFSKEKTATTALNIPIEESLVGKAFKDINLVFNENLVAQNKIICQDPKEDIGSLDILVGCMNVTEGTTTEQLFIGATRYPKENPQTPGGIMKVATYLNQATTTNILDISCETIQTEGKNSTTSFDSLCRSAGRSDVYIRYYPTDSNLSLWTAIIAPEKDKDYMKAKLDELVTEKLSSAFELVSEKAYAGGGGGGGGGGTGGDPASGPVGDGGCCPSAPTYPTYQTYQTYPNSYQTYQTYPNSYQTYETYPNSYQTYETYPNSYQTYQTYPNSYQTYQTYSNSYETYQSYPNSYESYESYPSYPTYTGPATISSLGIIPRSIERGGLVNINWSIYHPNNTCKITAAVQKPAVCDAACQTARNNASTTLNAILTNGTTNANDQYGANRPMLTALRQALNNPYGYARGSKSVNLDYSTTFTLSCGAETTPFNTIIYVTERTEG